MTTLTEKDRSIVTQVAAKIASDLVIAATKSDDIDLDKMVGLFVSTTDMVNQAIQTAIGTIEVQAGFPGSTVGPDVYPPTTYAATSTPITASSGAPVPDDIPGAEPGSETEQLWREYFANPGNFYDNRNNKRSAGSPDFAHKTKKNAKGYAAGLYLPENDKYKKNPTWVASALRGEQF